MHDATDPTIEPPVDAQPPAERVGDASYDPDDNKLRLRPFHRLDTETYERVHAAGFAWAPRQDLFVAPAWTPERADLLVELCGDIGDEDTTLTERAEDRAERFDGYHERRSSDAERAAAAVDAIAQNIPLGQPILVGHHSERHARRDAERIQRGMATAVRMWDTAQYWERRAAGVVRHAQRKEAPAVRARRIKTLEADHRKHAATVDASEKALRAWARTDVEMTRSRALALANYDRGCGFGLWGELNDGKIDAPTAAARAIARHEATIATSRRWLAHLAMRLDYERALLAAAGGTAADKFDLQPGGRALFRDAWHVIKRVNRAGGRINSLTLFGVGWKVGPEEIRDYQPPAAEDTAAVAKATKLPPLVNYPGEGFRHMTAEEFDRRKKIRIGPTGPEAVMDEAPEVYVGAITAHDCVTRRASG